MAYQVKDLDGKPIVFNDERLLAQDSFDMKIEDFSNKERSFLAVASAETPDRMGDIVTVKGWQLDDYRKNPVVMPFHNYATLPVGRSLEEFTKRKRLMFRPQFATYPETMRMYEMYRDKYLKGFSVGFVPTKSEPIDEEVEGFAAMFAPKKFLEQTLLEVSVAPVPAHQDALAEIKAMVKKGDLYIPAKYLEEKEEVQIDEYDNYFHATVNDRMNFYSLFIKELAEGISVVYGPYLGEDEKENHIYCFIFDHTKIMKADALEFVEKNKDSVDISKAGAFYNETKYTEKETVVIKVLPEVDEKGFEAKTATFKYCICTKCDYYEDKVAGEPCQDIKCAECGAPLKGSNEIPEKTEVVDVEKPYPGEHACRLRDPGDFKEGSFRRTSRKHDDKEYGVIMGRLKGETTMTEQAYRYKKDVWTSSTAKTHCKDHDGSFEEASKEDANKVFIYSIDKILEPEDIERISEEFKAKLPEGSKLIILGGGATLDYKGEEEFEFVYVAEKAGAVLNKKNKDKLGKAIALVNEVMASSEKEEESSNDTGDDTNKDAPIITITEGNKKELEPPKITITASKEDLKKMVSEAVKGSLGKLD